MNFYLVALAGLIIGFLLGFIFKIREKTQGEFRVNTTDPEKDVYRVEFNIPLGAITKYKILRLRVIDESESRE